MSKGILSSDFIGHILGAAVSELPSASYVFSSLCSFHVRSLFLSPSLLSGGAWTG